MLRPVTTQQNYLCSVDSLRSADGLAWADHKQYIIRKRFFCLCAGRTVFYGVAATRAPRSGFDCPAIIKPHNGPSTYINDTLWVRSHSSHCGQSVTGAQDFVPVFQNDALPLFAEATCYYPSPKENGPSISGSFPEFCQSVPFSIFHKPGACRPFFIVTNVGCYGRQMYFTTDIIPTFFSRHFNNDISPVVSLSIQKINKSAIPGAGRGLRQPAFLSFRNPARQGRDSGLQITYKLRECYNLSGAAPIIAVSPITQIGISRSFPAQSITCRSVRQYPIINLIPQRFFFLRDDVNFGWVTTWCDPMKRAAHFLVLSTGVSHRLSFVFPDMESEPQCDFHKGLKGNCGSTLHDRRTFSAREHTPLLRSFRKFGRACSVHRQMGRAAFFWNTPALNAAAIIPIRKYPENYAPLETGSHGRLAYFRVGAADPITPRPFFRIANECYKSTPTKLDVTVPGSGNVSLFLHGSASTSVSSKTHCQGVSGALTDGPGRIFLDSPEVCRNKTKNRNNDGFWHPAVPLWVSRETVQFSDVIPVHPGTVPFFSVGFRFSYSHRTGIAVRRFTACRIG